MDYRSNDQRVKRGMLQGRNWSTAPLVDLTPRGELWVGQLKHCRKGVVGQGCCKAETGSSRRPYTLGWGGKLMQCHKGVSSVVGKGCCRPKLVQPLGVSAPIQQTRSCWPRAGEGQREGLLAIWGRNWSIHQTKRGDGGRSTWSTSSCPVTLQRCEHMAIYISQTLPY